MANAKRASMREGPLAALFRKTEGEEESADSPPQTAAPEQRSAPPQGSGAARSRPSGLQPPPEPDRLRPHPRESGLPHPALSASTPELEHGARGGRARAAPRGSGCATRSPRRSPSVMQLDQPAARPVMDDYARQHPARRSAPAQPASR